MIYQSVRTFKSRYKQSKTEEEFEILSLDISEAIQDILNDKDIYRNKDNELYQLMCLKQSIDKKLKGF